MNLKLRIPRTLVKRVEKVASEKKMSFDDAAIFLLEKVNTPFSRARKGEYTQKVR